MPIGLSKFWLAFLHSFNLKCLSQFIFHNSPYWIRRDGAPSLSFLRFIIVLLHYVSSQHKRLRGRKESPLLSLQRRAQNNQCDSKLVIHSQSHGDPRSSVPVQINHTVHVKKIIISQKRKPSRSPFIASRGRKSNPPLRNNGAGKSKTQTSHRTRHPASSAVRTHSG